MTQLSPTLAERALATFRNSPRTVSLVTISADLLGQRRNFYDQGRRVIEFRFDDDSGLQIRGTGKNHSVTTF